MKKLCLSILARMRVMNPLLLILIFSISIQIHIISAQENQYSHVLTIDPPESDPNLWFGYKVDIINDKIIVSEPCADNEEIVLAGKVRIFDLDGNLLTTIQSQDPHFKDQFGTTFSSNGEILLIQDANIDPMWIGRATAYSMSGELLFVLEPNVTERAGFGLQVKTTEESIYIMQESSGDTLLGSSMVHIYNTNGEYIRTIYPPEPKIRGNFGSTITTFNDRVYISQYGAPAIDNPVGPGLVYVYDNEDKIVMTLESPEPEDRAIFGRSIDISDKYILIGEPWATVDEFFHAGKAHIFDHNGEHLHTFKAPNPKSSDLFGSSVGISEDLVIIGDGGSINDTGKREGKAHVFNIDGELLQTLSAPYPTPRGAFSFSIDVEGDLIAISEAWAEVEGNDDCGRVYLFKLGPPVDSQDSVIKTTTETEAETQESGGIPSFPQISILAACIIYYFIRKWDM